MAIRFGRVKLTEKNRATAAYLDRECFEHDSPFPLYEDTILWIGKEEGIPVAFCALTHLYDSTGFLSRAGVLPKYRGKGLHKRMIKLRVSAAKRLGWTALITYTARSNATSLNNLMKEGFSAYLPSKDWGGDQAVYLYKRLQRAAV